VGRTVLTDWAIKSATLGGLFSLWYQLDLGLNKRFKVVLMCIMGDTRVNIQVEVGLNTLILIPGWVLSFAI
jgi:hypothetical protein